MWRIKGRHQRAQRRSPCFTCGKGPNPRNFSVPTAAAVASDSWGWTWSRTVRFSNADLSSRLTDRPAFLKQESLGVVEVKEAETPLPTKATGAQPFLNHSLRPRSGREKRTPQRVRGVAWGRDRLRGHETSPATSEGRTGTRRPAKRHALVPQPSGEAEGGQGAPRPWTPWGPSHILTAAAATRKHQPGTKTRRGTGRGEDKWGKETASARTHEEGRHFRWKQSSWKSSSVPAHSSPPVDVRNNY